MIRTWLAGGCAALALGGLAAAPAAAQRISGANPAATNATIVLGQSPARACYESAAAARITRGALEECDMALGGDLLAADRAATHVNRAILRELRGDLDGAAADLVEAIAIGPDLVQARVNLGGIYAKMERWADARVVLDEAIALAPDAYPQAHFARGAAREELGDVEGAYADYKRAAELSPDWEAPKLELQRFQIVADEGDGAS
jgi:tetratricopeptide (TPR) repeat protein